MSDKLNFIIDEATIIELFGHQNFSSSESAIFEIIKNSFDAKATECKIIFGTDTITIVDDGNGMSSKEIISNWMVIGKSQKKDKYKEGDRVLSGSKGVGRFAVARLGNEVELFSKKENDLGVYWHTDWNSSNLEENVEKLNKGTTITISKLRDRWTKSAIDKLIDFLSRAYNDDKMKITIVAPKFLKKEKDIDLIFKEDKMGENYVSQLDLKFDAKTLELDIKVYSDEFVEDAKKVTDKDINKFEKKIDIKKELSSELEEEKITLEELKGIGDFTSKIYFSLSLVRKDDKERYLYKHGTLAERFNSGIALYRNSFSISSLEGRSDWFGIEARARTSPAAASHPTGKWRVRANQVSGYICIDREENKNLVDLSNRQGLDENIYYTYFKKVLYVGLSNFESYRQSIIRDIRKDNDEKIKKEDTKSKESEKIVGEFLEDHEKMGNYTPEEVLNVSKKFKEILKSKADKEKQFEEREKESRYDSRILNVLATQGLKASSAAHEFHTSRNVLTKNVSLIKKELERSGLWATITSSDKPAVSARNIPVLLEQLQKSNNKQVVFLNAVLGQTEKKRFETKKISLLDYFQGLKEDWERDHAMVEIDISIISDNDEIKISEDVLGVIFDNLILNSIQQNQMSKEKLKLKIICEILVDTVYISYCDNGIGLKPKYDENPFEILNVHETTRDDGHGLGMWMLKKTIDACEGEITKISGNKGFEIQFHMKGVGNNG